MNSNSINTYQKNQIITASPEQILLMLYDGAIRFTRRAITGIEQNDKAMVSSGISKALAIITEFSNTLNHEIGGEIAEDLDALYGFMVRELSIANIKKSKEKLLVVEKLLTDLRATWGEAVEINRREMAEKGVTHADTATVVQVTREKPLEADMPADSPPQRHQVIPAVPENYVPFSVSS